MKGSFLETKSAISADEVVKTPSPNKKPSNGHSGIIVSNFDVMSKI